MGALMMRQKLLAAALAITCVSWPLTTLGDDADGHMLAQACAGCHGADWGGQGPIVDLRGYDHEAFLRAWAEFQADERPATIMNRIARGYSEAEVAALADYFSSLE